MIMLSTIVDLTRLVELCVEEILMADTMEIRDVDGGEEAFFYSSGWHGPTYAIIKALVSWPFFRKLVMLLAIKVAPNASRVAFVVGNVTGGVIPGWLLSQYLETLLGRTILFIYFKGGRERRSVENPAVLVNKGNLEKMAQKMSESTVYTFPEVDFVAAAAPGGMVLGYRVSEILSLRLNRHIPFVYVRAKRKTGGQKELITGTQGNPFFKSDMQVLVVGDVHNFEESTIHAIEALRKAGFSPRSIAETSIDNQLAGFTFTELAEIEHIIKPGETLVTPDQEGIVCEELVNYANSTSNSSADMNEDYGFHIPLATCILYYGNPEGDRAIKNEGLLMTHLITLEQLLHRARYHRTHPGNRIRSALSFLADPEKWNQQRGFKRNKRGGTL
jgi:orotate phosphoribosyltransferase